MRRRIDAGSDIFHTEISSVAAGMSMWSLGDQWTDQLPLAARKSTASIMGPRLWTWRTYVNSIYHGCPKLQAAPVEARSLTVARACSATGSSILRRLVGRRSWAHNAARVGSTRSQHTEHAQTPEKQMANAVTHEISLRYSQTCQA